MPWIAGVDGCRAGWVAALQSVGTGELTLAVFPRLADLLASSRRPAIIAIDIPIGLADSGPRACDIEARRLLGPRRSSVFPPPIRPVLQIEDYPRANEESKRRHGKGLSKEAFFLMPKIREIDALVRRLRGGRGGALPVRECHPELAFMAMNDGAALAASKHTPAGLEARRALLQRAFGTDPLLLLPSGSRRTGPQTDDAYDALAVLHTARRIYDGRSSRVPASPPRDRCGLPMEINW